MITQKVEDGLEMDVSSYNRKQLLRSIIAHVESFGYKFNITIKGYGFADILIPGIFGGYFLSREVCDVHFFQNHYHGHENLPNDITFFIFGNSKHFERIKEMAKSLVSKNLPLKVKMEVW